MRQTVLVVDDSEANRELIRSFLRQVDCDVTGAPDGVTALAAVEHTPPDLVLLDVQMPGMDGYEVCRRIKAQPRGRLVPVVMITALNQRDDRVAALEAGADDFMAKPVDRIELVARTRSALRMKALFDTLESAERVIYALAVAIESKDAYTERHTARVAAAAVHIGRLRGLTEAELRSLYRGALLHDVGKIGVPDAVLLKPGPLDPEEWTMMASHPALGERIVSPLQTMADALPIIRHHHERFDGKGYPDSLAGEEIPLGARLVAVCDAFDALVSDRPYRPGRSVSDALATLERGAGEQWDPEIIALVLHEAERLPQRGAA